MLDAISSIISETALLLGQGLLTILPFLRILGDTPRTADDYYWLWRSGPVCHAVHHTVAKI